MAKLSWRLWRLLLVGLLITPLLHVSRPPVAMAQEEDDVMDEEEEDLEIEDEEEEEEEPVTVGRGERGGEDEDEDYYAEEDGAVVEEEEEEEEALVPHTDAETTLIFTNRPATEFVAGEVVHALMSLTNNWQQEFVVTGIEASFRYPQDFSYYIQNFSLAYYESYVMPQTQMSFAYSFAPSESFYARPFGLVVNMYYRDLEGGEFRDAVFNSTVTIVELEEGYDAETFFIYLFMVSGTVLLMFCVHYVYSTFVRSDSSSRRKRAKPPVETGTQKKDDIDYQWLPEGSIPGTPKKSPRASPRNRKTGKK